MKLNKVAMAVALTAALGSMSALADTTNGQIELQGELVNTACGLAPSSSPVTVDLVRFQFPCCKAVVRQLKPKTSSSQQRPAAVLTYRAHRLPYCLDPRYSSRPT